ncbi:MAG: hypothetical protein O6933_07915 [Planctomycetota bacterium]|nr:hypothetical protein [Planctomycetota bacterium]
MGSKHTWSELPGAVQATIRQQGRLKDAAKRLESLRQRQGGKLKMRHVIGTDDDTLRLIDEADKRLGGGLGRRKVIRAAVLEMLRRMDKEAGAEALG